MRKHLAFILREERNRRVEGGGAGRPCSIEGRAGPVADGPRPSPRRLNHGREVRRGPSRSDRDPARPTRAFAARRKRAKGSRRVPSLRSRETRRSSHPASTRHASSPRHTANAEATRLYSSRERLDDRHDHRAAAPCSDDHQASRRAPLPARGVRGRRRLRRRSLRRLRRGGALGDRLRDRHALDAGESAPRSWLDRFPREDETSSVARRGRALRELRRSAHRFSSGSWCCASRFAIADDPRPCPKWKANVDGDETTWADWLPDVVMQAAVLGWTPILVDAPQVAAGLSRAQAGDTARCSTRCSRRSSSE